MSATCRRLLLPLSQSDSGGAFHGLEINFCRRRNRLSNSIQRRGHVVVFGEEILGPGSLRLERRGSARQKNQRKDEKCTRSFSAKGHRTPFNNPQFCTNIHL